jgi:hypothetical protein
MRSTRRALRSGKGIAAARLTVNPHIAWYRRAAEILTLACVLVVLAFFLYDAGRRYAGFDSTQMGEEIASLRQRVADLEAEAQQLRTAESRMQIEKAAHQELAKQLKVVEVENARLREELGFFDNLATPGSTNEKIAISRFQIDREGLPGEYRYRVLMTQQGGAKEKEFHGRLQFVVNMQLNSREVMLVIPEETGESAAAYRFDFKRFHRAEGSFKVDPAATVRSVQVRVLETGVSQPRAMQSYPL